MVADLVEMASVLATRWHEGQTDGAGQPYITHPARVAQRLADAGYDERFVAAGWLHDVIEDCGVTADDLLAHGFPADVVAGVVAMTKLDSDVGDNAVRRAAADPIALVCKAADVADNSDPVRSAALAVIDPARAERLLERYAMYRRVLTEHGAPVFA